MAPGIGGRRNCETGERPTIDGGAGRSRRGLYDAGMADQVPGTSDASPSQVDPDPARQHQGVSSREPTLFDPHPFDDQDASERDLMDASQEFHDPIYGFVTYKRREIQIIDHPAFQRLFKVYQLGQTHLVFRGATHSRGQHSLGTLAALKLLISACRNTYDRHQSLRRHKPEVGQRWKLDEPLNDVEQAFARLAALLHDIGHVANGHTLEDELGLLHDHASRQRLDLILDRSSWLRYSTSSPSEAPTLSWNKVATTSGSLTDDSTQSVEDVYSAPSITEPLRQRIDRLYAELAEKAGVWACCPEPDERGSSAASHGRELRQLSASEILIEIIVAKDDRYDLEIRSDAADSTMFRVPVLRDLVGNTVCADLIDYLQRDWRHIGKPRYLDTRLLQYMEIVTDGHESKVAVNLRSNQDRRARPDVMSAILELLENRYHLWEVALLHRTKTSASAMLERAIMEKADDAGLIGQVQERVPDTADKEKLSAEEERLIFGDVEDVLLETILEVSDADACRTLVDCSWHEESRNISVREDGRSLTSESASRQLLEQLNARILHKEIVHVEFGPYAQKVSDFLSPRTKSRVKSFEASYRRLSSLRTLELDFELEPGSLAMYCLPFGLGKKLAEVEIVYDDHVATLRKLDKTTNVSGGHLQAQLNRHDRLWRASLFASSATRTLLASRGLLGTITLVFKRAVLGLTDVDVTMYDLAKILSHSGITYAQNARLYEIRSVAERGTQSEHHYPTGQPTLRSHFLSEVPQ